METITNLRNLLAEKRAVQSLDNMLFRPYIFNLKNDDDKAEFNRVLETPGVKVADSVDSQLRELIKLRQPSIKIPLDSIHELVLAHVGSEDLEEYGLWIYYPWSNRLVHTLNEDEFIELRTGRNKYKITEEEQNLLATKKVGVIGLSVGQSVSLTMAMERGFGELRIADFDELEITNLNRLRSGIHNMELKKTVLVAREIAEIDPFLKVTCFHEGITEDNIDDFLLKDGKLDVLIDECDSVEVKIDCRIRARKHQIPVLMEASDRGTIDIERFDLEPHRPILHGFVEHLDISKVKGLTTNEEKLPYILPIVGIETMSTRLKASAVEVGQSISTWPQLASAVTMGGGITADICRKVLLDQLHVSGRYFIDIDELICDQKEPSTATFNYEVEPLTEELIRNIVEKLPLVSQEETDADNEDIRQLVEAAALAPSAGNNQPWKWFFDGKRLYLFHDLARSISFGDFENMASYMSLGTAIENLRLQALESGLEPEINLFPLAGEQRLVASIKVKKITGNLKSEDLVLYIKTRVTNRNLGDKKAIDSEALHQILESGRILPEARIKIITDRDKIDKLADVMGVAEKLRLFIPQGHYDLFKKELRWTPESAELTRDGLDTRTLDLSPKDTVGFQVIKDPKAIELVRDLKGGKALEAMTGNLVRSASAVGLISVSSFNKKQCVTAGRAAQRAWLTATKHQISFQPILAPLLHFARVIHGKGKDMPDSIRDEFTQLHKTFSEVMELSTEDEPMFLFRLFYAQAPKVRSLRRDLADVYFEAKVRNK